MSEHRMHEPGPPYTDHEALPDKPPVRIDRKGVAHCRPSDILASRVGQDILRRTSEAVRERKALRGVRAYLLECCERIGPEPVLEVDGTERCGECGATTENGRLRITPLVPAANWRR